MNHTVFMRNGMKEASSLAFLGICGYMQAPFLIKTTKWGTYRTGSR